jgi:hypothetical protein
MIRRLIKSLREKPKSSRDTVAFISASLITGLVFTTWAYNGPAKHIAVDNKINPESQAASPGFSQFFDGLSDQIERIKEIGEAVQIDEEGQLIDMESVVDSFEKLNTPELTKSTSSAPETEQKAPSREVRIMTTETTTSTSPSEPNN